MLFLGISRGAVAGASFSIDYLTASFTDKDYEFVNNSVTVYDIDRATLLGGADHKHSAARGVGRHQYRGVEGGPVRGPCTLKALPTVLRSGPYRLFFYSADREEPHHVHVERGESEAKFWLDPARLETSRGFGRTELRRMEALVDENGAFLVRAWHEYFGD